MNPKKLKTISALSIAALALFYPGRILWGSGPGEGHEHGEEGGPTQVTVVGEVIDYVCYISHNSRGPEHKKCAEYCAKQGITLGILDEKTDEILLAFPIGHDNPNTPLMNYIAQRVRVTGKIHEKGGLKGIEIEKVEPIEGN
ncbi:MAG: hypothetical protein A2Z06_01030 [Candidatus Glassbacteria bacterium RBG_16_58_8]|uniref:Uncharacterized protein n=1 Tax=Candidatus Glassbacteria bacterium RBG_16_58_8 TaxID=1817866 RepID=A0A1F5YA55_9BACT|nr:MAG: hypothetical protein A2Z06_01030 [Candidatus Glassbacteria bacterium RBG_16_58_8]